MSFQVCIPNEDVGNEVNKGEFIRRNADPVWLHENEMWEYIDLNDDLEEEQ
ncbi:Uncharacterised protein [Candidatus Venteria ishoeyi]|uniref:Uncharacterized protein n=2 Tax=Candidatus Venteria ishoeyi TaxID=1899563 RepID=A0A1H6FDS2_9GAMM|nr:Uncharacterised protein [Candidatus Venteria ishoeyi]